MPAVFEERNLKKAERDLLCKKKEAVQLRGKEGHFALMTWELYEAIQETIEIYREEDLMADIALGVEQLRTGKSVSWDEAQEELGW